jgi:putative membrane protein
MLRWTLLGLVAALLAWSAVNPVDWLTWWLEVAPVLLAAPVLIFTARRFPLTPLAYILIALHAALLIVGGHWTYSKVPLGFWLQDLFGFERNPYDRIGHLAQGFVPALLARELLLRTSPLRRGGWLNFLIVSVCLAISAIYELIEWVAALVAGGASIEFLGTQGDVWDTQWDMFLAGTGAILCLLLLAKRHDRQLSRLTFPGLPVEGSATILNRST